MGGTLSTLRRLRSSKEQTLVASKEDDETKKFQEKVIGASPESASRTEEITDLASEQQLTGNDREEGENVKAESILSEAGSDGTPKVSSSPAKVTEDSSLKKQEYIADVVDEAAFPPIPPMPRDSDEIKLDENIASPGARTRTIYVSGDDREPELDFDEVELEVDHFTSAGTASRKMSNENTSVMVIGEPVIRHPFPSTPDRDIDEQQESITVVVNVESRHKGKRRRSTHSFTSLGSEPGETRYLTSNEIMDEKAEDEVRQSIEKDAKQEDVVEVKVDFYPKKRRRNCSAPCGYPALRDSAH